ncbi:membrin-11 [Cucumis melo var. makuwa]|uniref:Membrin-11 n=1 Tax=Cucumis melo var. makuwa TaxID=1194695 RepID=A0A5A7TJ80_CUCMM|nr:membrin-11 [Cucumis melo var. makuwa]TYK27037.1 membrin-11 [Cucumis melo var. makuwa]
MSALEGGGGGTLSEIYQSARRQLLRTRDGLEKLERLEYTAASGMDSPELSFSIKKDITQIQSLCVEMDRLWRSIAAKSQRDLWKRKVEQVAEEADSMKQSLDKYFLRNQKRMMEAKERAELLGRASGDSAHILRIFDDEAQAMNSVRNSSRMLEEASATGEAILFKYSEQRDRLKRAQRKALDVLNTVGLSNSVLKLIERRHRTHRLAQRPHVTTVWVALSPTVQWHRQQTIRTTLLSAYSSTISGLSSVDDRRIAESSPSSSRLESGTRVFNQFELYTARPEMPTRKPLLALASRLSLANRETLLLESLTVTVRIISVLTNLQPNCLSISPRYTKDQFVLGVPLGSPKIGDVPTGSQIVRVWERAGGGRGKSRRKLTNDKK